MGRHETRHMGDGGEIVIPKDMRERLGIGPGDEVTFEERDGEVAILGRDSNSDASGSRSRSRSSGSSSSRSASGRSSSSRSSSRKDCF